MKCFAGESIRKKVEKKTSKKHERIIRSLQKWFPALPGWKKSQSLSERLASLCIMGMQLWDPLKPLNTIVLWWSERFEGSLKWSPMMPRDVVVTPRCCFSSVATLDKIIVYLLPKQHHSLCTPKPQHFQSFIQIIHRILFKAFTVL